MYSTLRSVVALLVCLPVLGWSAPKPKTVNTPSLLQLTHRSGFIFAGTVLKVEQVPLKTQNEIATVQITFRVDQAIRGVSPKQILTIREWTGLWETGERYRPGEHVLLFLHRASKLGLTSPVGGSFGRFEMDKTGKILVGAQRLNELQAEVPLKAPTAGKNASVSSRDFAAAVAHAARE